MPRLSDFPPGSSIAQLYYGGSGTGKTNYLGTAGSRALGINIGGGIETIKSTRFKTANPGVDPFIETFYEETLPVEAKAFDAVGDCIDEYLLKRPEEFDTIWIDDVTATRRFAMNKGMEVNQLTKKSKSKAESKIHDFLVVAVQDYQSEMSLMEQFIVYYVNRCKEMNKHFIMTAHQRMTYGKPAKIGDEAPLIDVRPGFTGKTHPDALTGNFDLVWHAEKMGGSEQTRYLARTVGDSSLQAHTKIGVFPTLLYDPNFLKVIKNIQETR